jgi:hypothetical protein
MHRIVIVPEKKSFDETPNLLHSHFMWKIQTGMKHRFATKFAPATYENFIVVFQNLLKIHVIYLSVTNWGICCNENVQYVIQCAVRLSQ